jgi:hypothetical protein
LQAENIFPSVRNAATIVEGHIGAPVDPETFLRTYRPALEKSDEDVEEDKQEE